MNEIIAAFLGPLTNWLLTLSLAIVILKRHAIRKRHIAILVAITALGLIAFFVVFIGGFAWPEAGRHATLYQGLLRAIAGLVVGCGSAVGFSFILKHLGFASLEERQNISRPRREEAGK